MYRIEAEPGAARSRAQQAMAWLLSPKAQGIGEQLLHDAYTYQGEPIIITLRDTEETGFNNKRGEPPRININLTEIDTHLHHAADGSLYHFSLEESIAHELYHAGTFCEPYPSNVRYKAFHAALIEVLEEDETALGFFRRLLNTPDKAEAARMTHDLVGKKGGLLYESTKKHLENDPVYIDHIERTERPAIDVGNKVAALRGEPIRTQYMSTQMPPEQIQALVTANIIAIWEATQKKL